MSTQSSNQPTQGSNQPTQSSNQPTQVSNQPTQGSNQPTQGSNQPTQSSNQPAQSSNQAAQSSNQPTHGSNQPTQGSNQPTQGSNQPTQGSNQPTQSSNQPTQISSQQTTSSSNWRQIVTSLYPDALTRTYCVPPAHFYRVPYARRSVPGTGQSVLVQHPPSGPAPVHTVPAASQRPVPPPSDVAWTPEADPQAIPGIVQESDCRDDSAQNHVMHNLHELGGRRRRWGGEGRKKEVMFILSQLSFGHYLNQPAYAAAAAQLPRPSDLDTQQTKFSDGEADFVLIHRQHGILIGELKAVGVNQSARKTAPAQADADVAKRVEKAVKQLDRSERVVRHLVSDVAPGLTVRKTLFLPYVRAEQLERVLKGHQHLQQAVCQSLGAANTAEAVQLCCCSDQLSKAGRNRHVTRAELARLKTWWTHRMACTVDTLLTDDLYLDIVARFAGPATTVSVPCYNGVRVAVRTEGQAVAELGRRLSLLVLTPQQLDLMNRDQQLVCITGPRAQTVVLIQQGLRWLLQGHDVQVLSLRNSTRAVNRVIREQLGISLSASPPPPPRPAGSVRYHQYDFHSQDTDVERASKELAACAVDGMLFVLLDESSFTKKDDVGQRHRRLIKLLMKEVAELHLWAACVRKTQVPHELQHEKFSIPLRCAPVVQKQIQPAIKKASGQVDKYQNNGVPAPGDGPCVVELRHHGDGQGHRGVWPVECWQCGQNVAKELRRLDVGSAGTSNNPVSLSYKDVFILTRSSELHDDVKNDAGIVTSPACGLVLGLRDADIPVRVMGLQDATWDKAKWQRDVDDLALSTRDEVFLTHYGAVQGLERRVVVLLQGRTSHTDGGRSDGDIDVGERLDAASRCTTQLIVVQRDKAFVVS